MIPAESLEALRDGGGDNAELIALLATIRRRATPLLERMPVLPRGKAELSQDGGTCPSDGAPLRFDPWSPDRHRCPTCGSEHGGDRHHFSWARAQYLWLAERLGDLAVLAVLEGDTAAADRFEALLAALEERYFACENKDNVLGPTRLFFSTYLESLWLTHLVAAAVLVREGGMLSDEGAERINRIADEAANLIAEFNEGMSNRQTWHAAALMAVAAWFGDEELAQTTLEARTGILGHLADGFGEDGCWFEGENYHLFALRGLIVGMHWARVMGSDLLADPDLRAHFRTAVLAPSLTALPDLTYPARKDARYGVSLAQPAFLELFEIGRAWLGPDPDLDAWLAALYAAPAPAAAHYDAWLHDAGLPAPARRARTDLSPLALLALDAPAVQPAGNWQGPSVFLPGQGLAVLRWGDRYLSLECDSSGGGHGHADRLHLTLHAAGVHWLPDPGAGSYVHESLAWYRSAAAHNGPLLDGDPPDGDMRCEAFDAQGEWGWARGRAGEVARTLVAGPGWILDVVDYVGKERRLLELPWHLQGEASLENGVLTAVAGHGGLRLVQANPVPWVRAAGLALPTEGGERPYWVQQAIGTTARIVTVIDLAPPGQPDVVSVRTTENAVEVSTALGATVVRFTATGATVVTPAGPVALGGLRPAVVAPTPLMETRHSWDVTALAPHAWDPPAVDGTLEGFDTSSPLDLVDEHHYRRSEEPWDGQFTAQAWVNWDQEALYLAVGVSKPDVVVRPDDAPPLRLDNEEDDIHADGLQVYVRRPDGSIGGTVVTLREDGSVRCRAVAGTELADGVEGAWTGSEEGYVVTLRLPEPALAGAREGATLGFDLIVNEARPDRLRRAGQLVWSGGEGWVYLRGDRQDPARFGTLELG
ncbi:MAG TPA: heparinase II/III family protein [Gemmatimonadales bacterium]